MRALTGRFQHVGASLWQRGKPSSQKTFATRLGRGRKCVCIVLCISDGVTSHLQSLWICFFCGESRDGLFIIERYGRKQKCSLKEWFKNGIIEWDDG